MEKRVFLAILLSFVVLAGYQAFFAPPPVPVTGMLMWVFGAMSWRDWRLTAAIANPIERDARIKQALGFGAETFTRLAGLLRKR